MLGGRTGVAAYSLASQFRSHTSLPFKAHVRSARIARGLQLLMETCLSIKEIAGQLGYPNTSCFDRDCRRQHGAPPTELRKRAWGLGPTAEDSQSDSETSELPLSLAAPPVVQEADAEG
jgi:AraC-like DNA-binding protein